MKTVKTAKELGLAIKNEESYIYVEGDLKNKVLIIKATGKIAWVIAGGSIAAAIALYLATPAATVASAPQLALVGRYHLLVQQQPLLLQSQYWV